MNSYELIHALILSPLLLAACQPAPADTAASITQSVPTPTQRATAQPPTPPPPLAYVGGSVPCFAGPNVDENIVSFVEIGDAPRIAGKEESGTYWIVPRKDGLGYCWIQAQYVTVSEDPGSIQQIIMPTRTAIPPVPHEPRGITSEVTCQVSKWPYAANIKLGWEGVQEARGYRVYRESNLLAELAANEMSYVDVYTEAGSLRRNKSMLLHYAIEAFNDTGTSPPAKIPVAFLCRL